MKMKFEKISSVLKNIIGYLLTICLFAGGLGFFGFVIAFCLGGDSAAIICEWLSKTYYAYLIKLSTITTLACFILCYINGDTKKKKTK